ncbi:MAG: PQQ-dependent dehydrogenase, methanol/ethanol family [Candidatus Latescibacteria bacterium]|nr:PQQ-dependent dehydrogenase, methanol/ethanol family [Candidatus Latescibacterota bacterium]
MALGISFPLGSSAANGQVPAQAVLAVDDDRIKQAETEPGNWLGYGRTYEEQRFSPLDQINGETVARLGLAWRVDMQSTRGLEATPIVVDGVMFVTGEWSKVYAFNAVTGEQIWFYDPKVPREWGRKACCDVVNRGVAVYGGKVYVGSLDGRLIALDAATGRLVWEVNTIDRSRDYTITGAPRAARGLIFIGNGGAEYGVRGYATAYDADTGAQVWRFWAVPGAPSKPPENEAMALAAKTWSDSTAWELGGGGTIWNSIVYDADFDQVYLGTGNGSPWAREIRSPGGGDNLFLSSIVAVDATTGRYKWHYQTTPADNWDYTATQDMALADMEIDGVTRKVLLQAPKNGFFYVLDRATGELLRAHNYVPTTWATHVDMETGRPVENPAYAYDSPKWIVPGPMGGHNWQAMSVDIEAGLVYLPTHQFSLTYALEEAWKDDGVFQRVSGQFRLGIEVERLSELVVETPDPPVPFGRLIAFDPLTGTQRWGVDQPHYWNGGVLATQGGLVFQGNSAGYFNAYDAATGEELWSFPAHRGFLAPPVTYAVDGVQYIAVLAGTGGGAIPNGDAGPMARKYRNEGYLLAFALDGEASLPMPEERNQQIPQQPVIEMSPAQAKAGERLYNRHCAVCHGLFAISSGVIPDLRMMTAPWHEALGGIVLHGSLKLKGMPGFADRLNEGELELIRGYIVQQANAGRAQAEVNEE